jgi:tetratricopeptide (TPR) repeat protein
MTTLVPMLSPLIWTTMATGVSADVHGVLDFVEKDPATGQMAPITGRSRKVPAVWNIASALGLSVDVVGWWATWPAERINGTMVSDRLYYTLQQGIPQEVFHEDPPDLVFPSQRTSEFTTLRDRAVAETDWRAVGFLMKVSEDVFDRAVAENLGMEDPVDGMRRILSATRTYMGAGLVLAAEKPDLMMVYLEGTDTIGHLLAQYLPPPTLEIDDATAAVYAAAVPAYFEIVDRWIGRYLETCPLDEYAVMLVSDHGFKWDRERPRGLSGTAGPTAPLWHADDAVFVIAGAGVKRRGRVQEKPSVYDVAPTLAALLGVPADPVWPTEVFPGAPPADAAPVEWAALVPPDAYSQSGGGAAPADPEFIAKLKALGYIGEDGTSAGETGSSAPEASSETTPKASLPAAPTPQPATATRGQINNLAVIKINEKKFDEAERLLRQAIAMSPEYASPHYNLRRMYMETQQWEKADVQLWIAIDKGLRDPERTIDRAAADYESLSLPERAEALLTRAIALYPEHEPYYVHLMVLRVRADRCAEALPVGAVAAEKFPGSGPVHAFYGLAAASVGDAELARRELEKSLEINPNQPKLREALQQIPPGGGS